MVTGGRDVGAVICSQLLHQVNSGVKEANDTGEAIRRIQASARRVVEVVAEMSNAMNKQGKASEDIARISEQNSAVADQASQGAHELLASAKHMQGMVNRFAA